MHKLLSCPDEPKEEANDVCISGSPRLLLSLASLIVKRNSFCMCLQWLKLGLYRPIKNIRFIIGEGRSAGRRCQSPERSGAEGRGSEHGALLVFAPRRAAQAGLTEGAERS